MKDGRQLYSAVTVKERQAVVGCNAIVKTLCNVRAIGQYLQTQKSWVPITHFQKRSVPASFRQMSLENFALVNQTLM